MDWNIFACSNSIRFSSSNNRLEDSGSSGPNRSVRSFNWYSPSAHTWILLLSASILAAQAERREIYFFYSILHNTNVIFFFATSRIFSRSIMHLRSLEFSSMQPKPATN